MRERTSQSFWQNICKRLQDLNLSDRRESQARMAPCTVSANPNKGKKSVHPPITAALLSSFGPVTWANSRWSECGFTGQGLVSFEPHFLCLARSLCFAHYFMPLPICYRCPLLNLSGCQTDTLISLILHSLIDNLLFTNITNSNTSSVFTSRSNDDETV